MEDPISTKEAGAILGCHARTVRRRIDAGALPAERDEDNNYWIERRDAERLAEAEAAAQLATDSGGTDWNLERAKQDARIKRATADMREQERDEMLGKFHRAEFVRDCMEDLVFATRASVLALPGKLAPALAGEGDEAKVAAAIKSECNALLESLSAYGYSDKKFRELLAEAKGKEVEDGDA